MSTRPPSIACGPTPSHPTPPTSPTPIIEAQWVDDGTPYPDIPALPADHPPALRAVLVYEARGTELGPIRSSDDRAVSFFIDAPTIAELDKIEEHVRRAVTIHTTPS